ncbi:hypothetical protein COU61_02825 [Candidatus Pacearchaeota archaeon CG10_big_fil_rev_8_21_14_0_10_35_13]|nr:MAG: hypothetical protein COU61_02825 [Candidatus Pacearchaeota archaeon CG10_big_fil_rev_8_21_14_0_10_35_13]
MKNIIKNGSEIFLVLVLLVVSLSLVSASVNIGVSSTSVNTLPSDDSASRTALFNFNISNNGSVTESITLESSGFDSSWSPILSKSSDTLGSNSVQFYSLTLSIPKYISGSFSGAINIKNSSGAIVTSSPIMVNVQNHYSLVFSTNPSALSKSNNVTQAILKNDGNQILTSISVAISNGEVKDSDDNVLKLFLDANSAFSLNPQQTKVITINYSEFPEDIDLLLGTSNTVLSASAAAGVANASTTINFNNDYCAYGERGKDVKIVSVKDESSSSGNFDWKLLDTAQVDIKVENNGKDGEDITVEMVLYDSSNGDEIMNFDDTIFIDDGDRETISFSFVVPADLPDNARIYVKAYIDEEENCSNTWGSATYEKISIKSRTSYDVGFSDLTYDNNALCGGTITLDGKINNIGSKDQDRVLISLFSDELNIDEEQTFFNLDKGDNDRFSFAFVVPQGLDEKVYKLELFANHRYSKTNDRYDDVTDKQLLSLNVKGNCEKPFNILVTPTLDSSANAGTPMNVKVRLVNNGISSETVSVIPYNFESWAVLGDVQPSSVSLNAGESRDVIITMTPNTGASGQQYFTLRTIQGDVFKDQQVSVFVSGSSAGGVLDYLKAHWVVSLVILLNIILVVAIIIAVIRVARR